MYRLIGGGLFIGTKPFAGVAGYDGFGRQSGWVTAHGERFELDRAVHRGTRDHHWGTRDGVGGPALWSGTQHPHSGEWVEFEEYGVWGDHILYNLGDPRRGSDTLRGRRHRLRFEPDTHLLLSGEVDLVFADGSEKTMTFERLGNQIAFLRCGMYGGPNGGTPDGDIWHGMDVGDGVVSGETYDVNDPGRPVPHLRPRPAPRPVRVRGRSDLRDHRALRHPLLRDGLERTGRVLAPLVTEAGRTQGSGDHQEDDDGDGRRGMTWI